MHTSLKETQKNIKNACIPLPARETIILGQGAENWQGNYSADLLQMPRTGDVWLRFGVKGPVGQMTKVDALKLSEILAKMASS